jgi:hypothetical protein
MNSTSHESVEAAGSAFTIEAALPARRGLPGFIRTWFSFPVFLAFSLIALTALTVQGRFGDPDLWWHLRTGQIVWSTHSVPTTELFSHTADGHLWIPHEWLSQLSLYAAYRLAGYSGLMFWMLAFSSLLLVLLYGLCWLYSGNGKLSFLGGLIGWYFATVGLAARPLILGHALLVVELLLVQLGRTRDRRWFWGLPPLFAVWVNCHPSYSFGLLILFVVGACSFFELRIGPIVSFAWNPTQRKIFIVASLVSVAALLCNPMGWRLLTYPLNALFLQRTGLSSVDEWLPLSFLDARGAGLLLIMGATGLAAASKAVEIRLEELILVSVAAVLAVQHRRMLFLFGIIAAPVVCRLLSGYWEGYDSKRDLPLANAVCMAIAAAVIVFAFPSQSALEAQVNQTSPVAAVEFIRNAHLRGPMLNDYGLGGYLIWALPEHKVFVDGRGDVFDWTGVLESFRRWALLKEDPQLLLDKYHIQFCVLESGSPMGHVLPYLPGWRKAYGDVRASVFVRQDAVPVPQAR